MLNKDQSTVSPTRHVMLVGLSLILIGSCSADRDQGAMEQADLVLTGARIFTSNREMPWADTVAINDGRFVYVGDAAGASGYRSDSTRFVDLKGRLVIPGLVDAHAHLLLQ